jgi:hypothetical protein
MPVLLPDFLPGLGKAGTLVSTMCPLPAAAVHGFPDVERIVGRHSAG